MVEVIEAGTVTIRPMRREEIGPLAKAIEEMSEAQIANRWREKELGYRELLVAERGGELVGTVSIYESERPPESLHLFALEVSPRWRNQGIGTELIRYVLDEARRRGRVRVFLEVRVDNPARRLYHRLGFRRVGPAFVHTWWQFSTDGSDHRIDELSYRMVRRITNRSTS